MTYLQKLSHTYVPPLHTARTLTSVKRDIELTIASETNDVCVGN